MSCARIDNNRREYCEENERKDGVHACVLRIFFSLRSLLRSLYNAMWFLNFKDFEKENNAHSNVLLRLNFGCVRIDNNRREYW